MSKVRTSSKVDLDLRLAANTELLVVAIVVVQPPAYNAILHSLVEFADDLGALPAGERIELIVELLEITGRKVRRVNVHIGVTGKGIVQRTVQLRIEKKLRQVDIV